MGKKQREIHNYIKLDTAFFRSDIHMGILSLKNGNMIINIYFTLCALACDIGGPLYEEINGVKHPYTARRLMQLYPQYTEGEFEEALKTLVEYGLLESMDDGGYAISGFLEIEGHETYAAREQRARRRGSVCPLPWEKAPKMRLPGNGGITECGTGQTGGRKMSFQEAEEAVSALDRWVRQNYLEPFQN